MKNKVKVGDLAPDFELSSQSGEKIRLTDFRDKKVVILYFYPKDNTPGCTTEACAFRDNYEIFKEAGAEVIGVSSDTEKSHDKFALKYELPFKLLSDVDSKVRKEYGAVKLGGMPGRVTYVIDKKGVIRYIFSDIKAKEHVDEALRVLRLVDQFESSLKI